LRLHGIKIRLAELERLLSHETGNQATEFQNELTHWLLRQEEYRHFARELFERISEAGEPDASLSIKAEEWECLRRWIERAESAVRAQLKSGSQVRS
jgi:hypothetical protein